MNFPKKLSPEDLDEKAKEWKLVGLDPRWDTEGNYWIEAHGMGICRYKPEGKHYIRAWIIISEEDMGQWLEWLLG